MTKAPVVRAAWTHHGSGLLLAALGLLREKRNMREATRRDLPHDLHHLSVVDMCIGTDENAMGRIILRLCLELVDQLVRRYLLVPR